MRRRWTVTSHVTGRMRCYDVVLYERTRDLRGAATRHSKVAAEPEAHTLACVQTLQRFKVAKDGTDIEYPEFGIVRFAKPGLTRLIVWHEAAHLAAALYGLALSEEDRASDHLHGGNESLAETFADVYLTIWSLVGSFVTD